jgi:AraC-like DNA-binding protein
MITQIKHMNLGRSFYIIPEKYSKWIAPESSDMELLYLGWGKRNYHRHPIPSRFQPGYEWIYILEGNVVTYNQEMTFELRPGDLLIAHPDFQHGQKQIGNKDVKLFVIQWKSSPELPWFRPSQKSAIQIQTSAGARTIFSKTMAYLRNQVKNPNALSVLEIKKRRLELEGELSSVLGLNMKTGYWAEDRVLELAENWANHHVSFGLKVNALAAYLEIHPVQLNRIFHRQRKMTTKQFLHQIQMREVDRWIRDPEISLKEIAHRSGFRQSAHLCESILQHYGKSRKKLFSN